MMLTLIRHGIMNGGLRAKLGYLLLKSVFHQIGRSMNTSTYGGAVLLGLKAPVVKTHGASDALAIKNTVGQIHTMLKANLIGKTVDFFTDNPEVDKSTKNE